jgi:hypothetical protein
MIGMLFMMGRRTCCVLMTFGYMEMQPGHPRSEECQAKDQHC